MEGVRRDAGERGPAPRTYRIVIHGTTLATNAVIERKGARTALLTTEGLPRRPRAGQREPLRPVRPQHRACRSRWCRAAAAAGAGAAGQRRARAAAARRGGGASADSAAAAREGRERRHRLPARLRQSRARAACARRSWPPRLPGCRSRSRREVSPEMREWERFSTTVANAYVQPLHGALPAAAGDRAARGWGCTAPAVPDAVGRRPDHAGDGVRASRSAWWKAGPAGGAIFAAACRAPVRAAAACCPSTWAARRPRSA